MLLHTSRNIACKMHFVLKIRIVQSKCYIFFQYLSKKLGADPTTFGQLQTVFAVAQLMGGPFFGRAGDTLGEKFALILAFTGAMMSYLLMGLAESISILFLSRLPSVVMHTMQGIFGFLLFWYFWKRSFC